MLSSSRRFLTTCARRGRRLLAAAALVFAAAAPALAGGGPPWWVAVSLGATNQNLGLTQIEVASDGQTAATTIDGQECRNLLANGSGAKYLYLGVDDAYYHDAGPGVTVAVHYYSTNNVTFWIEYEAADGTTYKASSTRNTGSAGVWKKALFWLPDPALLGDQNGGADLRIATHDENSDFYIAGVALARPLGPYVAGDDDADFSGETFAASDKLVATTYFYWYDTYSGRHLTNGDGSDGITDHPALDPNVTSCEYVEPNGPQIAADTSWESIEWHKRQMLDMADAGLDIAMPVYWGGTDELLWAAEGVGRLVQALDELSAAGHNPPKIGMFFDTTTLQQADDIFNIRSQKTDLTTADGRNFFIKQIIDFFSLVPPKYWARIDGKPVIFLYVSGYTSAYDQAAFTELDTRFAQAFGGLTPYVVREDSWSGVTTDSEYSWGAALNGPQIFDTAAVGPGFDNSAVPGGSLYRDRAGGVTYSTDWATILGSYTGHLVHVETWSEFHEATDIADSQEYGRQYIDLTQQYAAMFKGYWGGTDNAIVIDNTIPSELYAGASADVSVTVKNTGASTWSEADSFRLGAVDDSDPFYAGTRVQLPAGVTVAPGETYTFTFSITAPASPGDYTTDWQMVHDGTGWFGQVHRETVAVLSGTPDCNPPVDDRLIVNPEFAGGGGSQSESVTGTVPAGWRAVADGTALGEITLVPLAADELYPGSPVANAALWHAWADPNGGGGGGGSSAGDAAIDLDDDALRLAIPAENRVYQLLVDARDGSVYGGTPHFGYGLQFADMSYNAGGAEDPGADFETFGLDAMSDTGGTLSARLDTGNEVERSVQLDNVRIYDVTDTDRMVNGDFEYSDTRPVDWRFVPVGAEGSATISHDAYSGNNSVLLECTSPGADFVLDVDPWRIPVFPSESLYVRFRAKKISGDPSIYLRCSCGHFDANGQYLYVEPSIMAQPGSGDWETYFLSFQTTADTHWINVAFRITDSTAHNVVGAYLIDDVSVIKAEYAPPVEGNILHDGDFEDIPGDGWGTEGGYPYFDLYDTISIPYWRVFAVGGAYGGAYGRSAAATSGALGVELFRTGTGQGGDTALDKDDPALREFIPAAERVYMALVDVKDGGQYGGSDSFAIGIQFPGAGRGIGFDPGSQFETVGVTARSNTSGQASVRFDLGPNDADGSVYLDNARLYDVTYGANRIVNGDFENSDIQPLNWRFFTTGGAAGSATISHDAYTGNNAVLLDRTNTDGDTGLDLDLGGMRVPAVGGETYRVSFAAKKVSGGSDARISLTIAQFDDDENYVGNVYAGVFDPGSSYATFVSDDLVAQSGYLSVALRVLDPNSQPAVGSYLIDDVQLVADQPAPPGGGDNLLVQGDFEDTPDGTTVSGHDFIDVGTIDGWRCFAVSTASASFTVTSAAASSGNVGVEYVREADYSAPGDRVFDDYDERFELRPGLWYHAEFYVKTGNADDSDQEYTFSFPLYACDYTGNEPGNYTGVATGTWQKVVTPLFQVTDAYNGHVAWRVSGDDGAIMVAMPKVVASESSCPGDLNGDGVIDLSDLAILLANYGSAGTYADGDLNCDGMVDLSDLAILLAGYGQPC